MLRFQTVSLFLLSSHCGEQRTHAIGLSVIKYKMTMSINGLDIIYEKQSEATETLYKR